MTPEEQVFLTDIEKDPRDEVTRLVYSDWLLERGEEKKALEWRENVPLFRVQFHLPWREESEAPALYVMRNHDPNCQVASVNYPAFEEIGVWGMEITRADVCYWDHIVLWVYGNDGDGSVLYSRGRQDASMYQGKVYWDKAPGPYPKVASQDDSGWYWDPARHTNE